MPVSSDEEILAEFRRQETSDAEIIAEFRRQEAAAPLPPPPAPTLSPGDIQREVTREFFNSMKDDSLPLRMTKLAGAAGGAAFGALFEIIPVIPVQQALFRNVQGMPLGENLKRFGSDITAPQARAILKAFPPALQAAFLNQRPDLSADEFLEIAGPAFFPDRLTFRDAVTTSTIPALTARAQLRSVLPASTGAALDQIMKQYVEETGNESPTVGDLALYTEEVYRQAATGAAARVIDRIPRDVVIPVPASPGLPPTEFIGAKESLERAVDASIEGGIGAFYFTGDVVLDPFLIDAAIGGPGIKLAGKGIQKALRTAYRGAAATSRQAVKAGTKVRAAAKGTRIAEVKVGGPAGSVETTLYPEVVTPMGPGRVTSEAMDSVVDDIADAVVMDVVEGSGLPTRPSAIQPQDVSLGIETVQRAKGAAIARRGQQALPAPRAITIGEAIQKPTAGMSLEGFNQGLVTVDDAPLLTADQILAGAHNPITNRPNRNINGLQRSLIPVTERELEFMQEGMMIEAHAASKREFAERFQRDKPFAIEAVHIPGRGPGDAFAGVYPDDVIGIYKFEEFQNGTYRPIAAEGGRPSSMFPTEKITPSPELERQVEKNLKTLREGTEIYHHTSLGKALGIATQGKIGAAPSSFRPDGSVSFTRQDVSRLAVRPEAGIPGFKVNVPTSPEQFLSEFGPVRLVTTRETVTSKVGKTEPFDFFKGETRDPDLPGKAIRFEAEERVFKTVPFSTIHRIDIDPSAFSTNLPALKEANFEAVRTLIKLAETQGIPVYVRPLYQQNGIQMFRPFVDSDFFIEKVVRGPDSSEAMTKAMISAATAQAQTMADDVMTSVEVAAANLEHLPVLKQTDYVGKQYIEALGIKPNEVPKDLEKRTRDLIKNQLGNDDPGYLMWLPDPTPIWTNLGNGKAPKSYKELVPPFDRPHPDTKLLPPPQEGFRDLGFWGSYIDEPVVALGGLDHPNGRQILLTESASRFDKRMWMSEQAERLAEVERVLLDDFANRDKSIFRLLDVPPDDPVFIERWKAASQVEKDAFRRVRIVSDLIWEDLVREGKVTGDNPKYLRGWAAHIFPDEDVLKSIPLELRDDHITGNVMFHHLKKRTGAENYIESVTQAMRAYIAGAARKLFDEPAWNQMLKLAESGPEFDAIRKSGGVTTFPPAARAYVEDWVRGLKGRPAEFEKATRAGLRHAGENHLAFANAAARLSEFMAHAYYRGALLGSTHLWLQNWVTQGIQNPAAKYGPYRLMQGISRHMDASWRGLEPQPALVAGWQAIWDDLPVGGKTSELAAALKQKHPKSIALFSDLMKQVEETAGVTAVEMQVRGVAWQIGAAQEMEKLEQTLGRRLSVQDLTNGTLSEEQVRRIMLEGVRASDDMNFLYGVYGTNPRLRQIVGGKGIGITFQFLSYYGKELGWLFRKHQGRRDPGMLLRYLEIVGVLDRLIETSTGIEASEFNIFQETTELGMRVIQRPFQSLGPLPSAVMTAMQSLMEATFSDDPGEVSRLWDDFFRNISLATPAILAFKRTLQAAEQAEAETRISPWSDETLRQLQPEDVPALIFGSRSMSDAKQRELSKLATRLEKARTVEMRDMAQGWLDAHLTDDRDRMALIEGQARRFGLNFTPFVTTEVKKLVMSNLVRRIEDMGHTLTGQLIINQIINEFDYVFDESQTDRFQEMLRRRDEKRRSNDELLREEFDRQQAIERDLP